MDKTIDKRETGLKIASMLLRIQAIKLNLQKPFVWASGWKSPIYCDNRKSLGFPEIRSFIKEHLSKRILQEFPEVESIAGVATAGIPQGALVADLMKLPFIYVRSKPKGHGLENLIEGSYQPAQKVVLVEDLISTAGSSLKAAEALRGAGLEVLGLASIFNYGFDIAAANFQQAQVAWFSLSNYNLLIEQATKEGIVNSSQVDLLEKWRTHPDQWSITH